MKISHYHPIKFFIQTLGCNHFPNEKNKKGIIAGSILNKVPKKIGN